MDKRIRVKITVSDSLATGIAVTCLPPLDGSRLFAWEIKKFSWNLTEEDGQMEYEQLVHACQKEKMRNFNIAYAEAMNYKRNLIKEMNTLWNEVQGDYKPIITKEEIITRILALTEGHS